MNMWGEAGFLSRVFQPFGELDVSVDLVATSQYAVSLTLDHIPGGVHGDVFARLLRRLGKLGAVSTREPCAVVSIVGERLRNALPELGAALEELRKREVHLMTQSSEGKRNFNFFCYLDHQYIFNYQSDKYQLHGILFSFFLLFFLKNIV